MSMPLSLPLNVSRLLRPLLAALLLVLAGDVTRAAEGELEVPPDLNALRAMAESGQARAQTQLADILAGNGDFTNAVTWYRKAAQQGEVASQLTLATLLITGRGAAKNPQEAAKWLRAAADRIEGVPPKATNAVILTKTNAPVLSATNTAVAVVTNARPPAPPSPPKVPRADILQPAAPTLQDVQR